MNQAQTEQIRARFAAWVEENGTGAISRAAHAIGLSNSSALSSWKSGKYRGDNEKLTASVASFLDRETERDQLVPQGYDLPFRETSVTRRIFDVARKAHLTRSMCVAVGGFGTGKTRAIKEYTRRNAGVILIECHRTYRTRDLIGDIHRHVGFDGKGNVHSMMRDICEKLRDSGRLVIVDEAENIRPGTLDEIRRIYDWANIGILYVGQERFLAQLRGMRSDYGYITSRIRSFARVEGLRLHDTSLLVDSMIPNCKVAKDFHELSGGNARVLRDLILDAIEVARVNDAYISRDMIEQIAQEARVS